MNCNSRFSRYLQTEGFSQIDDAIYSIYSFKKVSQGPSVAKTFLLEGPNAAGSAC